MSRRNLLVAALRVAVGVLTLALLIHWIDFAELREGFGRARPGGIVLAFALFVGVALLDAWRLVITFSDPETGTSFREATVLTLIGMFWGNFTPGLVGAEVYKAAALGRRDADWVSSAILITTLRLLGFATALAWAVAAVAVEPELISRMASGVAWSSGGWWQAVLAVAALAVVGALALAFLPAFAGLRRHVVTTAERAVRALRGLRSGGLLGVLGVSALLGLFRIGVLWALTEALAPGTIGPAEGALVVAASILAIALPLSIGGLGIQEGAIAGLLVLFGLPAPDALAVALTQRAFLWVLALLGGALFVLRRPDARERPDGPVGGS